MASKIKLFQSVQKCNRSMGIYPHPSKSNRKWTFNAINLIFLIGFAQMTITSAAFSFFQAESTIEYGGCFYIAITETGSTSYYLIQMWQINNLLKLIEQFEDFIENSEFCFHSISFEMLSDVYIYHF